MQSGWHGDELRLTINHTPILCLRNNINQKTGSETGWRRGGGGGTLILFVSRKALVEILK